MLKNQFGAQSYWTRNKKLHQFYWYVHYRHCWCENHSNYFTSYIFVICVSPVSGIEIYNGIFKFFITLIYLYGKNILILGDLNFPEYISFLDFSEFSKKILALNNFCEFGSLIQFNSLRNGKSHISHLTLNCTVIDASDSSIVTLDAILKLRQKLLFYRLVH